MIDCYFHVHVTRKLLLQIRFILIICQFPNGNLVHPDKNEVEDTKITIIVAAGFIK